MGSQYDKLNKFERATLLILSGWRPLYKGQSTLTATKFSVWKKGRKKIWAYTIDVHIPPDMLRMIINHYRR